MRIPPYPAVSRWQLSIVVVDHLAALGSERSRDAKLRGTMGMFKNTKKNKRVEHSMTITHVSRRQLAERNVVGKVVVSFVFVSSYYCLCRDVCRALTISRPPFFLQRDNPLEGKESASGVELSRDM